MKLTNIIDPAIRRTMESENEKALRKMMHNRDLSTIIPMHTANMNIYQEFSNEPQIRPTIIPELAIYIDKNGIKDDQLSRNSITYRIAYNNAPIPLSHVYNDSGSLCLGNIFVPAFVSIHSPQLPLETLFLHNDRNMNHGNPKLPVSCELERKIKITLDRMMQEYNGRPFPFPLRIEDSVNWVQYDILWQIGSEMLKSFPKKKAFENMDVIFKMIFPPTDAYKNLKQ